MRFTKRVFLVLSIVFVTILSACGDSSKSESKGTGSKDATNGDKGTIEMAQISWAENIAVTNMWKVILEEQGYKVKLNLLDMGTIMKALAEDELDINLEVWLPIQDKAYLQQYKDQVFFAEEPWYDNAKVGLVVPTYLENINSIEDLNKHKDMFAGEITGFDPGAGTMEVTEEVIKEYDLDYELIPSSEPAMITEIDEAIKKEEPIVAPLWNPHRVFSQFDLKYLEDPKKVYGEVEKIYYATRLDFEKDFPEVSEWMKNWKMDDEAIGELMTYVNETEEPIEGAKKWVDENQDRINKWMK